MQEKRKTGFKVTCRPDAGGPISTEVVESRFIPRTIAAERDTSDTYWKVFSFETLKGLLFFLPGTILLAMIGVVTTVILADIFVFGRPYRDLPDTVFEQIAMLIFVGLISSLMVWFGIGSLKDRRHFALPLSVFACGVVIGSVGLVIEALMGTRGDFIEAFADHNVIVFLLPLLLVIPVLIRERLRPMPEMD